MGKSSKNSFSSDEVIKKNSILEIVKADYFSYEGRLNREKFVFRSFVSTIILALLTLFFYSIADLLGIADFKNNLVIYLVPAVFFVTWAVVNSSLGVRRAHDLNRSGKWYLWLVAFLITVLLHFNSYTMVSLSIDVVIGLFFIYCYCFYKGTVGTNKYGKDEVKVGLNYAKELKFITYLAIVALVFTGINSFF